MYINVRVNALSCNTYLRALLCPAREKTKKKRVCDSDACSLQMLGRLQLPGLTLALKHH